MQNDKSSGELPTPKPNGRRSRSDDGTFDSRKQWLSRRDIEDEYGWSYKTTIRLERAGKLIPSVIDVPEIKKTPEGKIQRVSESQNGTKRVSRIKRYFRPHIEALLRDSFASLRALRADDEEAI